MHPSSRYEVLLAVGLLATGSVLILIPFPPGSNAFLSAFPTVLTQLRDFRGAATSRIVVGGNVTDSATLSGAISGARGTVTYSYFANGACSGPPLVTPTVANGLIVNVTNGAIPNTRVTPFNSAGAYSWNAAYSGDNNNGGSTSSCEPLTVEKKTPSLGLIVSSKSIEVGASAAAVATLTNFSRSAGGTVTYEFFPGNSCAGTNTTVPVGTGNSALVVKGVFDPSNYRQFSRAGNYSWNAVYGGDGNNTRATSPCVTLTIEPKSVTARTTLVALGSASLPITVGGAVYDTVQLVGGTSNAGGVVSYQYYSSPGCQGLPRLSGTPMKVSNGVVPRSNAVRFNVTGAFSWNAIYSGDNNNTAATSPCEGLTVKPQVPTISLFFSSSAIAVGDSVTISTNLQGGFHATGNVAYSYFFGSSCPTGTPNSLGSPPLVNNSVSSTVWSPDSAGIYSLNAAYRGDGNNAAVSSQCLPLFVNPPGVRVTTSLLFPVLAIGAPDTDSATLLGATKTAGGTVTYQNFKGSACSGPVIPGGNTVTVTNGTVPRSASVSYPVPGSYSWNAVYSGDAHNNQATSPCEPLIVGHLAITSMTLTCTKGSLVVGSATTCRAVLSNGLTTSPSGRVVWSTNGTGTFSSTSCVLSRGACSVTFKTGSTGTAAITVNYGGDANNFPSPPATFNVNASPKKSTITVSCSPTSVSLSSKKNLVKCKAVVKGFGDLTGESVSWVQSGSGFVSFVQSSCDLVRGSCTVTLTGAQAGAVTITATYEGDSNNLISAKSTNLSVKP